VNFFLDNPDLFFRFESLDLARAVELREDGFKEAAEYAYAPTDFDDARDSYRRVLELAGDIAAEHVAPRAEDVDRLGSQMVEGEVCYPTPMAESLERLRQADLMGMTLPRRYGGLSLPVSIATMIIEMISRADASLMNVFGLQDIGETINKFASEEIKAKYLPRFASGEVTGSMALTESEAGSDLQRVNLKAELGDDGRWYLTGVKRFITNGCGQISLVLARSEEGTADARGLSMFLYEREEHLKIRRIEDKLGIHGSPTCEMQFEHAPALLVGERRRGLITYVASLMDGARLAIGAQAVGIAEAAYQAAEKYSGERIQFGAPIKRLPAVAGMLAEMNTTVKAARALLYETALIVDLKEGLEREAERNPDSAKDLRAELKRMARLAGLFTPLCKAFCAEAANRVAYDSLQIHGGSGYMRDYAVERHVRDARITNIYEGTTQLQVVAAIGGVLSGTLAERLDEYDADGAGLDAVPELRERIRGARRALEAAVAHVRSVQNPQFRDFNAGRLVAMAADVVCSALLARDAATGAERLLVARRFVHEAAHRVEGLAAAVLESGPDDLDDVFALA
jgi:3-(methylthio)propanoyl-CoA dehydrogenase